MYKNLEIGRSMIEMLGVLAIIGVLSVGGITGYSKAMEKIKINKTIDEISTIIANTQTLYAQQKGYSVTWTSDTISGTDYYGKYAGLTTETAFAAGIIPENLRRNQWTANNPFGGRLSIRSGDGKNFIVEIDSIPISVCIALGTYDWGHAIDNVHAIAINGITSHIFNPEEGCIEGLYNNDTTVNMYYACEGHLPISAATAAKYCNYPVYSDEYRGFTINIKE